MIKYPQSGSRQKVRGPKNLKTIQLPTVQYSFPRDTKKLVSIHREGIRIYTGAFKTSPVESFHVEAYDPLLQLRRNELGRIFV